MNTESIYMVYSRGHNGYRSHYAFSSLQAAVEDTEWECGERLQFKPTPNNDGVWICDNDKNGMHYEIVCHEVRKNPRGIFLKKEMVT